VSSDLRVAVVGATGMVGGAMVRILEERRFPVAALRLFATARSAGKTIPFKGQPITVEETGDGVLDADLVLFAGGDDASRRYAWGVAEGGGVAVDNSSTWRLDPRVPLVVPEVNADALRDHQGVIANPNCCAVALVMALKPIHDAAGIRRCIVSTYQSVSGGGLDNVRALLEHTRSLLEMPEALEQGDLERIGAATSVASPVAPAVEVAARRRHRGRSEGRRRDAEDTGGGHRGQRHDHAGPGAGRAHARRAPRPDSVAVG